MYLKHCISCTGTVRVCVYWTLGDIRFILCQEKELYFALVCTQREVVSGNRLTPRLPPHAGNYCTKSTLRVFISGTAPARRVMNKHDRPFAALGIGSLLPRALKRYMRCSQPTAKRGTERAKGEAA